MSWHISVSLSLVNSKRSIIDSGKLFSLACLISFLLAVKINSSSALRPEMISSKALFLAVVSAIAKKRAAFLAFSPN